MLQCIRLLFRSYTVRTVSTPRVTFLQRALRFNDAVPTKCTRFSLGCLISYKVGFRFLFGAFGLRNVHQVRTHVRQIYGRLYEFIYTSRFYSVVSYCKIHANVFPSDRKHKILPTGVCYMLNPKP